MVIVYIVAHEENEDAIVASRTVNQSLYARDSWESTAGIHCWILLLEIHFHCSQFTSPGLGELGIFEQLAIQTVGYSGSSLVEHFIR